MAFDISLLRSLFTSSLKRANIGKAAADVLEQGMNGVHSVAFTIGTEDGSNVINVAIQASDAAGNGIEERCGIVIGLFADANGDAFQTAEDYTIAAGTDGDVLEVVADKLLFVITEADGDADIDFTLTGAGTSYLIAFGLGGQIIGTSGAMTHAA